MGQTRHVRGVLVVTVAVSVVACSCQSMAPPPVGEVATSTVPDGADAAVEWVLVGDDVSMHLRWIDENGQLAGIAQIAERNAAGTAVDVRAEDFVGATNGGQVVLTAQTQRWSGASTIDTLVLSWARGDGASREITLRAGTAADFEAAISTMRSGLPSTTTAGGATSPSPVGDTAVTAVGPEVLAAVAALDALHEGADLADIEAALDVMEALAGAVGGGSCPAILVEIAAVQDGAETVGRRLRARESAVDDVERQRDAVNLLSVAFGNGPAADSGVIATAADALARADRYIDDVRSYASDVRAVVDDTVSRARANFADC